MENEEETREYVRQCYAEVMASGAYTMVLPVEYLETLQNAQEEATPEDTWIGMIQQFLDDSPELTIVCTRLIWHALFAGDQEREPKRYELNVPRKRLSGIIIIHTKLLFQMSLEQRIYAL